LVSLSSSFKQELFKPHWCANKGGGQIRKWELEETGDKLLTLATEDDIIPDTEVYYIQDRKDSTKFYRTAFDSRMDWDTVVELCNAKWIYKRGD
jgi:hypothetical protein